MLTALRNQRSLCLINRATTSLYENYLLDPVCTPLFLLQLETAKFNPHTRSINQHYHNQKQAGLNVSFKRPSLPDAKEGSFGSRFCPPSQLEVTEERIKESVTSRELKTKEDWAEVKAELMTELQLLNEVNFSSILMNCLLTLNKVEEAHYLLSYLREANIEINFLAYLKYMDLCAGNVDKCGQDVILRSYAKVKPYIDASPVIDLKSAEHLFRGLCATDQWAASLEHLKKVADRPNMTMKHSLASAAVRNGHDSFAWEILTKWYRANEQPNEQVFRELFLQAARQSLQSEGRSEELLKRIFTYMTQRGCVVEDGVLKEIKDAFRHHSKNWQMSYSKINRDGTCESCKKSLFIINFTAEDFVFLRSAFLEKSLKKSDLFINTTEREFQNYINFINFHKPFDIVLDGLNAAHCFQGRRTGNPKTLAQQLLKTVEALSEPTKRLLVLGRNHMRSWPIGIMKKISQKAKIFFTSNISQDDPFMVYAALVSGPHATIVSSDLMRDHIARLEDPLLIQHFKKWQQTHQMYIMIGDDNEPCFVKPLQYSISVQGSMNDGWHIPFDDGMVLEPYEELNNWLCVQKKY